MSKKIYIVISICVVLAAILAVVLYWPEYQKQRAAEKVISQRMEEIRQANPELLQKFLASIEQLERQVKDNPKDYEAFRDLGVNYNAIGDYAKAEKAYKRAAEILPNNVVVWNNLGELYKRQGRFEEAKSAFLKLLEFDDTDVKAYLDLAEMYAAGQAGTLDDAKFILQQGILKTQSGGLKDALERLNREGRL